MTPNTNVNIWNGRRWLIAVAAGVLAVSVTAGARIARDGTTSTQTTKPQADPQTGAMSDDELAKAGEALVKKVCDTACHGLEKLDEMRRTRKDWSEQVTQMTTNGAQATTAQFTTIKQYLTRYYGIVAVNTAAADELSAVLGLSAKDAAAIVAYRTANGKFADVAALLKVPGIDTKKIEEQSEAIQIK